MERFVIIVNGCKPLTIITKRSILHVAAVLDLSLLSEVTYSARNIYETETVTAGLCYIEDLIFLENYIVWFWNSLDVQSTNRSVELYNILSYLRGFLTKFCTSFWQMCIIQRNCKFASFDRFENLFVLTVSYVDIKTYSLTKYYYLTERVCII